MSDNEFKILGQVLQPASLGNLIGITNNANFSNLTRAHDEHIKSLQKVSEEKWRKERQRDEWLKNISDNVLAIKNNSDGLILSIDDLIQTIVVSNTITDANMFIIEQQLEKIKDNGKVNKVDEIKKATIALAAQKGLECGFVFLLKSLMMLGN